MLVYQRVMGNIYKKWRKNAGKCREMSTSMKVFP